jgi:hypothetical protein
MAFTLPICESRKVGAANAIEFDHAVFVQKAFHVVGAEFRVGQETHRSRDEKLKFPNSIQQGSTVDGMLVQFASHCNHEQ